MKKFLLLMIFVFGLHAESITELKKACDLNDSQACITLGNLYTFSRWKKIQVKKDYVKAEKYYSKACDLNTSEGYKRLGDLYTFKKDYETAKKHHIRACEIGDVMMCYALGRSYGTEFSVLKDFKAGIFFYTKACDGGIAKACGGLAHLYKNGQGVKQDDIMAVKYFTKACDGGDALACDDLGFIYLQSKSIEHDHFKAVKYFTKACDGSSVEVGCHIQFGLRYYYGRDAIELDDFTAEKYYNKLYECDSGNAKACGFLGFIHELGFGRNKDYLNAVNYYTKACDGGDSGGCYNLGYMFFNKLNFSKA